MRKSLLLLMVSLTVLSASAQLSRSDRVAVASRQDKVFTHAKPAAFGQSMQMRTPGEAVLAPRKASHLGVPYYNRPAGAFHAAFFAENGAYGGSFAQGFMLVKPYNDYTYHGVANGAENGFSWWYNMEDGDGESNAQDLALSYPLGLFDPPVLDTEGTGSGQWGEGPSQPYTYFQYPYFFTDGGGVVSGQAPAKIMSLPFPNAYYGMEFLMSSKTFVPCQMENGQYYTTTIIDGPEPFGNNDKGWWFGKNGGTQTGARIDGIAQAFEKPEHPYLLNKVAMELAFLEVSAPVTMTCKVYQLDSIPAYNDTACVVLPELPGKLIAIGRAAVTPQTYEETYGLVEFTLYGIEEGYHYPELYHEVTPTVDYPILVVLEGYNLPGMENLVDFTALVSCDYHTDEGFGELAYIKYGVRDENSGQYNYQWKGLNNFFPKGEMKTGFTIFLTVDQPFLVYNILEEDGEHTFPNEGGTLVCVYGDTEFNGIEFFASTPSGDDEWKITCNGDEDIPEWLDIELVDTDTESNEFGCVVTANVEADPLPEGVTYREAVVRFEIAGDYKDFKFIQGVNDPIWPWWPDGPNIGTVNWIIDIILGAQVTDQDMKRADVNQDGVVNISDVNAVIDLILRD